MNQTVRLHRDAPSRRAPPEPPPALPPDSAEAVLARGHRWLRFPPALEAGFTEDTLEPRRRWLVVCALLGCLGVLIGSFNVNAATPEIASKVWALVWGWMGLALACLLTLWNLPRSARRAWQSDGATALLGTLMAWLVTWMATASQANTAITHSAMAAAPVMYACIAARVRFYWSLGMAVVTLAPYLLCVTGHTPLQAVMVQGITQLMALSYTFALLANYAFEHQERRNWLLRRVEAQQREALQQASAQLRVLSIQDPLTGLHNRRQFDACLREAIAQARRNAQPLSMLAIDVDDFKRYNDSHGHAAGDHCLIDIARTLAVQAKAFGGQAARIGGEEFALILPDHPPALALKAGEAVCLAIAALGLPHGSSRTAHHVTVSVGVATWPADDDHPPEALLARADQALYQAKASGRNRAQAHAHDASNRPPATHGRPGPADATPDADADVDTEASGDGNMEAAYQATLDGQFHTLRFPPPLEQRYVADHAAHRRRQLWQGTLFGVLIYNLYALGNRFMYPDIPVHVLDLQYSLSMAVLLLALIGHLLPWPRWREGAYSLSTIVLALGSTWALSHSVLTSTLCFAGSLMLIPMFAGVASRQPFWFTCAPAVCACLAAAWLLQPVGPEQQIVYGDNLFMMVNNMAYTLILAYALEHNARKAWLLARIDAIQREALEATGRRLKALSVVDPLTGISNRRQFEDDLNRIWLECLDDARHLGMLIIDVDHFKRYNDKLGHLAGDDCLRQVATCINDTAQAGKGLAARLGGEEFGVLLPGGTLDDAWGLAERIRQAVCQADIPHDHVPARQVTVSVGVASLVPQPGLDLVSLFATADKALYEAKRAGRNRVMGPIQGLPARAQPPGPRSVDRA